MAPTFSGRHTQHCRIFTVYAPGFRVGLVAFTPAVRPEDTPADGALGLTAFREVGSGRFSHQCLAVDSNHPPGLAPGVTGVVPPLAIPQLAHQRLPGICRNQTPVDPEGVEPSSDQSPHAVFSDRQTHSGPGFGEGTCRPHRSSAAEAIYPPSPNLST